MDVRKQSKATESDLGSAAKENLPPEMARRTVSVSTLFDQTHRLRKLNEENARDVLAPRPAGISKSAVGKERIFAQYRKPKAKEHPVYTSFKQAAGKYYTGVSEARSNQLQPVYEALIARVDGKDIKGRPLEIPRMPSQAEINALHATEATLAKPLDDEVLTLQISRRNGVVETRNVRLGDALRNFETTSERKQGELEQLYNQLESIHAEITDVRKDAMRAEKTTVKKARMELAVQLDGFTEEALKIKERTDAECKKALKEDQTAKREWERKLAALYDEL